MKRHVWEEISGGEDAATTERMRVSGGWLYRTRDSSGVAMVFVPDPKRGRA
jgi:hypothetical protein